jgi:hypothetical protein
MRYVMCVILCYICAARAANRYSTENYGSEFWPLHAASCCMAMFVSTEKQILHTKKCCFRSLYKSSLEQNMQL